MIKKNIQGKPLLKANSSYEGEAIERKVERIVTQKEPITDGAPLIYTERKDGVQQGYDVRTDRFEVAIEAMDKVSKAKQAKRMEYYKKQDELKGQPNITEGQA